MRHPDLQRRPTRRSAPAIAAALAPLAFAPAVAAAAAGEARGGAAALATDQIGQVLLGLLVVIGAIGASAWIGRRLLRVSPGVSGHLRLLGGLSLGPRERIVLVQAGDTQLLVGVAPGRVQTLHVLDRPVALDAGGEQAGPGASFRSLLGRVAARDGRGGAA